MISVNSLELISLEFFTGNPQSVRGLGNILLDKEELDMLEYYSEVELGQDSVFETVMPVYSMSYLDDGEGDLTLPYDVNTFLLGAVKSVRVNDGKLEVNRYESSDLEVVTLRQLKHALSGKVKDITYTGNVLQVVTFERSDLLGLQTKAAIVSLLTNAVSDVRIVNNELVVERWSDIDVATGITGFTGTAYISLSATNPYLMSGETTDLVVSLVDEFGSPVPTEVVSVSDGTSVYTGITNNNGTYTKTGVSVNNVTGFTATYNALTSNVTLYPCIFRDYAVTGNKSTDWYVRSTDTTSLSVTVDNEGTTLSSNDTSTSRFYFANPEQSTSTSPPITISDFVIECDVVSTTFGSGSQIAFLLQGLTQNFNLSNFTPPYHLKMEKIGDTVKMYVDDNNWRTTTISSRTNYYMGFQLYKTGSIKFKNYIIYEL